MNGATHSVRIERGSLQADGPRRHGMTKGTARSGHMGNDALARSISNGKAPPYAREG